MMIESNHEVNVAKNGSHYCRIELGSGLPELAIEKFEDIKVRFPKCAGFEVTLNKITCYSEEIKGD